jgi:cathepsin L
MTQANPTPNASTLYGICKVKVILFPITIIKHSLLPKKKMKFLIAMCIILWACAYTTMSRTLSESSVVELHQQWMIKYGRTYTNSFELEKRKKIFQENLEYIENFNNAGNKSYKLGLNPYSDLTSEEFIASHTGLKVPSQLSSSNMESVTVPFDLNDNVPTNFDWRQQGVATNVKNQGNICGNYNDPLD